MKWKKIGNKCSAKTINVVSIKIKTIPTNSRVENGIKKAK